jgi:hypothetical protein
MTRIWTIFGPNVSDYEENNNFLNYLEIPNYTQDFESTDSNLFFNSDKKERDNISGNSKKAACFREVVNYFNVKNDDQNYSFI